MTHAIPDPEPSPEPEPVLESPTAWVETWPTRMTPVRNGEIAGAPVEVYQYRPGGHDALLAWAGQPGDMNPDGALVIGGRLLLPLGDYLISDAGQLRVEAAAGFHARYARAG